MKEPNPIELDGRTGEGGGQLVRIAVALSAVSSQPIRIVHVRGNRPGSRGGGLKSQHVTALTWLAQATQASTTGLEVGSHTLEFRPRLRPCELSQRKISIAADSSAASTMLIFQAVLPFLLFAGGEPIELEISGGTNTSYSLSYEYMDQVLAPALEHRFGVRFERRLLCRGFSQGPSTRGKVWFRIHPLPAGQTLRLLQQPTTDPTHPRRRRRRSRPDSDFAVTDIDISILTPADMHEHLTSLLAARLGDLFPGAELRFVVLEESGHASRMYALCVARAASSGLRWGRDVLWDGPRKNKSRRALSEAIAARVTRELSREVGLRGEVDEFLQDQLVVFQALAEGRTSFRRREEGEEDEQEVDIEVEGLEEGVKDLVLDEAGGGGGGGGGERMRRDKALEPFGEGSTHTTTARWVTAELLPQVKSFNKGRICEGIGISFSPATEDQNI